LTNSNEVIRATVIEVSESEVTYYLFDAQNQVLHRKPRRTLSTITYENGFVEDLALPAETIAEQTEIELNADSTYSDIDSTGNQILGSAAHDQVDNEYVKSESKTPKADSNQRSSTSKTGHEEYVPSPKGLSDDPRENYHKGQREGTIMYSRHGGAGTGTLATSLLSPVLGLIPAIITASNTPRDKNLGYQNSEYMRNMDYARGYKDAASRKKRKKVWKNWGIGLGVNLVFVLALQ